MSPAEMTIAIAVSAAALATIAAFVGVVRLVVRDIRAVSPDSPAVPWPVAEAGPWQLAGLPRMFTLLMTEHDVERELALVHTGTLRIRPESVLVLTLYTEARLPVPFSSQHVRAQPLFRAISDVDPSNLLGPSTNSGLTVSATTIALEPGVTH